MYVCISVCVSGIQGSQNRVSDSVDLNVVCEPACM